MAEAKSISRASVPSTKRPSSVSKLIKEFGTRTSCRPQARQDRAEHGRRRGHGNDTKKVTVAAADLALIAGQKPVITQARKSIAGFKVRENMPLGVKVTLRKQRMYEFLDRLVNDRASARS